MLKSLSPENARELRAFFAEARFGTDGLREVLGINELPSVQLRNLPRLLDRTSGGTTLHALIRLFCLAIPVEYAAARRALTESGLDLLELAGLVTLDDGFYRPNAILSPFEDLLIATDGSLKIEAGKDPDVVLLVNPTTWLLHRFSVRRPSRATLDLGAGCGALGLAALRYSQSVVATDLNPRATEFAKFNANLNGCDRIECLTGNAFDPVQGRKFDLILTNPPFFVSPSTRYQFCDNDLELDLFCRNLVRAAPAHLNDGGILQMVCEWVEIEGQPWTERLAEWMAGSGCDAWILRGHSTEPNEYAYQRIRETTVGSVESDAQTYDEWMSYYRSRKVAAIHRGLIAIRRRDGSNWIRIEEMPGSPKEPFGDSVLAGFAARDFLGQVSDDAHLLAATLSVTPKARLERRFVFGDDRWHFASLRLFHSSGMPHIQAIEPPVAELIRRLDGETSVGAALDALPADASTSREAIHERFLPVVRRLIECGFLEAAA